MEIDVLELLDRPIAYHVIFARITGSVTAAVFLSQAFYWQYRGKQEDGGWWWHTQKQWTDETGLSRREQETARKKLRSMGVIEERDEGMPSRKEYRLNFPVLLNKIEQYQQNARKCQTRMAETTKYVCTIQTNRYGGNRHIPETIPKTRLENTTTPLTGSCSHVDMEEYLRLVVLYGGKNGEAPRNPVALKKVIWKRFNEQGGLSELDQSQLEKWRKRLEHEQNCIKHEEKKAAENVVLLAELNDPDRRAMGLESIKAIRAMLD